MFGNAACIDRRARSIRRRFLPDEWQSDDWENLGLANKVGAFTSSSLVKQKQHTLEAVHWAEEEQAAWGHSCLHLLPRRFQHVWSR